MVGEARVLALALVSRENAAGVIDHPAYAAFEEARDVLPLCLKTEIVCTWNLREWHEVLRLRTAKDAHPAIRALMVPVLKELQAVYPEIFNDIEASE